MKDLKDEDSGYQAQQKDSSSTLVSYDVNYAPQALGNWEGVKWSIPILILNAFVYGKYDPVVQSIHLPS